MSDFDLFVAPQGHRAVPPRLNIVASVDANAEVGLQRRKPINFADTADYCRPRS